MATAKELLDSLQVKTSEPSGFGAYGASPGVHPDLARALDKPPAAKVNGSLAFTEPNNRWLKNWGITSTDPHSFHKAWETDQEKYNREHRKWSNTYGGRLAIRSVSRGVVGAAFFAGANMYVGKAMKNFSYDTNDAKGVLPTIARFIDNTAGKAIKGTVKAVTGDEGKAVRSVMFRDTRYLGFKDAAGKKLMGRSLGSEAVHVTFDFAAMSFGDYMTRYFVGLMDPNARKEWMKDGHIDVPGALKDVLKNVFRGATYAAGEDMAVAIPYVYGLRLQRNMLNKFSPGFAYDSDRGLNGGSVKVKDGKVVGDYQLEGALDLMGRFSWYNVGTKMFRDAYSKIETKLDTWWEGDRKLHMPTIDPQNFTPSKMLHGVTHGINYVVRTTLKVMSYMIPATAFFFISRTPQSRVRGIAIDQDKGVLGRYVEPDNYKPLKPGTLAANGITRAADNTLKLDGNDLYWRKVENGVMTHTKVTDLPFTADRTDAIGNAYYEASGVKPPWYNKVSNPIAKLCYDGGTKVGTILEKGGNKANDFLRPFGAEFKVNKKSGERFARTYLNAAVSYTPYFMAKTDVLSAEWDTSRMDMAFDRMLAGAGHLKWGEFKSGLGEVMRAAMREPFTDPNREIMAQKRRWRDDAEHMSNEAYQLSGFHSKVQHDADGKRTFASDDLKPKKITPATHTQLKPQEGSWAAQEAVRKFEDLPTQGQSVH